MENEVGISTSLPVVLFLACSTTQSALCSCVVGGSDEVAGWRWGFPALPLSLTLALGLGSISAGAQEVTLSTRHMAGFPPYLPVQVCFHLGFNKTTAVQSGGVTPHCPLHFGDITVEICHEFTNGQIQHSGLQYDYVFLKGAIVNRI